MRTKQTKRELRNKKELINQLVKVGRKRLRSKKIIPLYANSPEAAILLNDLDKNPHAFVIMCLMNQQVNANTVGAIPYELSQRLGYFDMKRLAKTKRSQLKKAMRRPTHLHRFSDNMAEYLYLAIQRIQNQYGGNAANIWNDNPSSAKLVQRFLEFEGVGLKIATMASNLLVRNYKIPVRDYYSIDISADVHIKRIFRRMGFVPPESGNDMVIYCAREIYPKFPGIFDYALWDHGRKICVAMTPKCDICTYNKLCPFPVTK